MVDHICLKMYPQSHYKYTHLTSGIPFSVEGWGSLGLSIVFQLGGHTPESRLGFFSTASLLCCAIVCGSGSSDPCCLPGSLASNVGSCSCCCCCTLSLVSVTS